MELDSIIETRRVSAVSERVLEAYEGSSQQEGPSAFLDIADLGHHCDRFIWLKFRWAFFYQRPLGGREEMAKKRSEREKEYVVHNLNAVNIPTTYTEYAEPAEMDFGCHIHGCPDGYLPQGVGKDESTAPHSLSIDPCSSLDRWLSMYRDGLKITDKRKYFQLQLEMYGFKHLLKMPCERALYYAPLLLDDRIYTERIPMENDIAEVLLERGKELVLSDHMPDMAECEDCKHCPFAEFCHEEDFHDRPLPEINCRTCCHCTPKEDGSWYCERWEDTIPTLTAQHHACNAHVINPDLVPEWTLRPEKCTDWSACYDIPNIGQVINGEDGNTTTSIMRAVLKKRGDSDEYIDRPYTIEASSVPDPNDIIPF